MSFDHILGHDNIKKRLLGALDTNTVSHAYIFCGNNGIGKTTTALAFAKMLTADSRADTIYVTNEHYGVGDKASLSVETVRAARVDMFTKPYLADKKVFIFPKAETMTNGAQNALLKVFEEPPSYCVIILLAQNENLLLPTIRSRAVTLRFSALDEVLMRRYLTEKYGNSDDVIIRLSAGSVATADQLMAADGIHALVSEFIQVFKRFTTSDRTCVYDGVAIFERDKSKSGLLLDLISAIMYDSAVSINGTRPLQLANIKQEAALEIIRLVENARRAVATNRNYNIVISELLIDAWRLIHD